jgi:hypothetical protein
VESLKAETLACVPLFWEVGWLKSGAELEGVGEAPKTETLGCGPFMAISICGGFPAGMAG